MSQTPQERLAEEDLNAIQYFITYKGDITRWVGWESKKHLVEKQLPDLIHALKVLALAENSLKIVTSMVHELAEKDLCHKSQLNFP